MKTIEHPIKKYLQTCTKDILRNLKFIGNSNPKVTNLSIEKRKQEKKDIDPGIQEMKRGPKLQSQTFEKQIVWEVIRECSSIGTKRS